ncbi:MAG: S8 family serine peptidase [Bacteroidetes bacterium]|nr:S8 family serine peptidase [Bacteroidota bacterium]
MLKFVLSFYLFVYTLSIFAVTPKPNSKVQLIVKLRQPCSAAILNELTTYKFKQFQNLNIENTLFGVSFNENELSETEAILILQKLPIFELIQKNHILNFRGTTPNDSFFNQQWFLNLIRATEAWDLQRSATNRRGDTIVIAVIDDGLHINHPDFKGNIWINYADIKDNGIDDDGNGYIDDHYGWNFMGRNNDISDSTNYKALHGSQVAGIIGAKTNNSIGVSGIMWNVKLMMVNIADTSYYKIGILETDAIRAYSYVLNQRKLYNESNGLDGAFVVATNASWGIDNKFANDAPIWCGMYDNLGQYGILNVSATSNNLNAIDVVGDLPSLCTSQHLMVVGSSTQSDGFNNCGYSSLNVDISAPGSGIFTTNNFVKSNINNNSLYTVDHYGTSYSAPMVAAAIGILQGYACEIVLDSIKQNPAKANLMLRQFILESTDESPALLGRNATNGRLNIKKAMQKMDAFCYNLSIQKRNSNNFGINIFPNPGNGSITIDSKDKITLVKCYDITGKEIAFTLKEKKLTLDASKGVYLIEIRTSIGVKILRYIFN